MTMFRNSMNDQTQLRVRNAAAPWESVVAQTLDVLDELRVDACQCSGWNCCHPSCCWIENVRFIMMMLMLHGDSFKLITMRERGPAWPRLILHFSSTLSPLCSISSRLWGSYIFKLILCWVILYFKYRRCVNSIKWLKTWHTFSVTYKHHTDMWVTVVTFPMHCVSWIFN